jgi:hypothetical protein
VRVPRRSTGAPPIVGVGVAAIGSVGVGVALFADFGDPAGTNALWVVRASFGLFGALAIGFGAYLMGVRLPRTLHRALWGGQVREVGDRDGVLWTTYPRPLGARIWDVAGPAIGLVIALGAVALGFGSGIAEALPFGLIGIAFLALMAPGLVLGIRRAFRESDSLRVSAAGIWMPAVGTIPWEEIESIGVDDAATAFASLHPDDPAPANQSLRLAVTLRPGAEVRGRTGLDRYFLSIARLSPKPPPLGVFEGELPVVLEEVLPIIERYRPAASPAEVTPAEA